MKEQVDETVQYPPPSRSEQRRQALDVLALAAQLVELAPGRLNQLPIPEGVRTQIDQARRISSHIARKRQLGFVAKTMRREDDETLDAIRDALDVSGEAALQDTARLHRAEHWRERLLTEGDIALAELISAWPKAERQQLRQLVRQALAEAELTPNEVDLICGSSWGSQDSDLKELTAIDWIFGSRAAEIPLVNHNGHFGFVESAAALLNLAMVLTSAEHGQILPIAHTREFCRDGFDFATTARQHRFSNALILGATEGGGNYALLIGIDAQ